jgi:hypothetical protein
MAQRSESARKRHRARARGRKRVVAVVSGMGLLAVGVTVPAYAATHAHPAHPVHPVHPVHPAHPAWAADPARTSTGPKALRSTGPAPIATSSSTATADSTASASATATPSSLAVTSAPVTTSSPAATPTQAAAPAITPTPKTATPTPGASTPGTKGAIPRPDHIVVVVEENHSYSELASLPYSSSLMAGGATLTQSYALTHPSQPNYFALWSGSTQGVTDDSCPHDLGAKASLGSQLRNAGLSVRGYMDSMPSAGFAGCSSGAYVRKHNPLANFDATKDAQHSVPFTAFPTDFSTLPTVSFVAPDLGHDMHDGSVQTGDTWLKNHLGAYAAWAKTHNSLLILTADEDDKTAGNHILTVVSGEHVQPGVRSGQSVNHYSVLHTIEDAYGLPHLGPSASSITGIWQ